YGVIVGVRRGEGLTLQRELFLGLQLRRLKAVFSHWIVVSVVVDEVELVDEGTEELARNDADVALEAGGHIVDEAGDEVVTRPRREALPVAGRIEVAEALGDGAQAGGVEGDQLELGLSRV